MNRRLRILRWQPTSVILFWIEMNWFYIDKLKMSLVRDLTFRAIYKSAVGLTLGRILIYISSTKFMTILKDITNQNIPLHFQKLTPNYNHIPFFYPSVFPQNILSLLNNYLFILRYALSFLSSLSPTLSRMYSHASGQTQTGSLALHFLLY